MNAQNMFPSFQFDGEFTIFPRLAAELGNLIWKLVLPKPRTLNISIKGGFRASNLAPIDTEF